ncbi:MAG: DJ-1/PfpI family protein [Pseudomonadota bacterium]
MTSHHDELRLDRRAFAKLSALGLSSVAMVGVPGATRAEGGIASKPEAFTALRGKPLNIGILIFPDMDQIDFTGPFEVLSRVPDAKVYALGARPGPFRDHRGLIVTPDMPLADAPPLDLLQVAGGPGQQALMHDAPVLDFIRAHVAAGKPLFSVCTGALICGAAGVLKGRRATTHWSALDLLPYFGATPVRERVVIDGNIVTAAGVTAGIDGALTVAALLRSDAAAQKIQLDIQYAPNPPFHAGTPETAPQDVLAAVTTAYRPLTEARLATAREIAKELGVAVPL